MHNLEFHSVIVVPRIEEIRSLIWNNYDDLFFSWGSTALGVWNTSSIGAINPAFTKSFKVGGLQFGPDRSVMLLKGGKNICLYYPEMFSKQRGQTKAPREVFVAADREVDRSYNQTSYDDRTSNLRRVEVDTTRRSHEIRTEDLIDMYDRRATPEKKSIEKEYESHETFGRRDDYYDKGSFSRKR